MPTTNSPQDPTVAALAARFRAMGDPQAFGALYDATAPSLFRVALTLVPDATAAEDVLQQPYLVALRKLARLAPDRPPMPWLLNVLAKEASTTNRARRRGRPRDGATASAPVGPVEPLEGREASESVHRAIGGLEEPYRSAALLRWR